jgi:hypothetical protein
VQPLPADAFTPVVQISVPPATKEWLEQRAKDAKVPTYTYAATFLQNAIVNLPLPPVPDARYVTKKSLPSEWHAFTEKPSAKLSLLFTAIQRYAIDKYVANNRHVRAGTALRHALMHGMFHFQANPDKKILL